MALLASQKEVLSQVIHAYKDMPYLYDRKDRNYYNKSMRDEGFEILLKYYKKLDNDATVKTIKKKIDNLKTAYFREFKKVQASRGTGEVYVPSLWYYEALSFIGCPKAANRSSVDEVEYSESSDDESQKPEPMVFMNTKQQTLTPKQESSDDENDRLEPTPVAKKKKFNPTPPRSVSTPKQDSVVDQSCHSSARKEDDFDVLGKSIAIQLRELNKLQLAISRKLISDVLYYGTLDKLKEDSRIDLGSSPFDE